MFRICTKMCFTSFEAIITICCIFFGYTYCYSELNGTISGVKTILKGILFECSNAYKQKSKGDKNCESYLSISIKTDPNLHINKLHQFLTLDEIYVANRFVTAKLVAPYVIEIIRGEPLMMCPLDYDKSLTAKGLENGFQSSNDTNNKEFIIKSMQKDMGEASSSNKNQRYKYDIAVGYENRNHHQQATRYSVFNTNQPIPFLVTTVKIFQKRYATWWKMAPSITVDSYSGFYANGNLTVWLKYHINIFQLSKSIIRLKNFKLLIPTPKNPEEFYNSDEKKENAMVEEVDSKNNYLNTIKKPPTVVRAAHSSNIETNSLLDNCPYNSSILCINILDDVVAGYSLKIRLPFLENDFIKPNVFKIKIINAITDATVKDTVKISITLINEGFEVHEFAININCLDRHIRNQQNYRMKKLLPHVGETIEFLLPFIFKKIKKASKNVDCKIQVTTLSTISAKRDMNNQLYAQMDTKSLKNQRIVMTRKITIIPHYRCLCVWKCSCHCLAKLETNIDFNVCQELDSLTQSKAGLLANSNYYELHKNDSEDSSHNVQNLFFNCSWFALLVVLCMGVLGFCKAILGICIPFVDKWGYDYLQPGRKYVDTSKLRHFLINFIYFILLPFLICCNCFTPSVEDLLISNSENFMTKMYMYVYEVFYDMDSAIIIIEEIETTPLQTDEY